MDIGKKPDHRKVNPFIRMDIHTVYAPIHSMAKWWRDIYGPIITHHFVTQ